MTATDEDLLRYFRKRCCDLCSAPAPSEPHHVHARGMGGGSRLDKCLNLVSVCRPCHQRCEDYPKLMKPKCLAAIARREGLTAGVVQRAIWRMLRT